ESVRGKATDPGRTHLPQETGRAPATRAAGSESATAAPAYVPPFLDACRGNPVPFTPVWVMRQAGRYLPEYRAIREKVDFLTLTKTPDLAAEVTLQPIRRFGMDAAILFSDIMTPVEGMGIQLDFAPGPVIGNPVRSPEDVDRLSVADPYETVPFVMETIRILREELPVSAPLIGFAGAPWTLFCYAVEGKGSKTFIGAKSFLFAEPAAGQTLLAKLADTMIAYLRAQAEAGAQALMIFDSWAGALPVRALRQWSLEPLKRIVAALKARHPEVPVILFPRGAGLLYLDFAAESGAEGLSLDSNLPPAWAAEALSPQVTLQGNLDPLYLVAGGSAMDAAAEEILSAFEQRPFIFNLGHGVVPQTPPENVERLLKVIRG
ncbi:MAG: uroporphyrinogen decarboxylase, partial [Limibacillus sp.]